MVYSSVKQTQTCECTLALLAYNQEDYIDQALFGATAQTYDSLEIIVSDDCSSDKTTQKIDNFFSCYTGPHVFRVIHQPRNLGTIDHLITVARAAQGRLLIVAACDDISYPDRVQTLYNLWSEREPFCVYSAADIISPNGDHIGHVYTEYLDRIQVLFEGCLIPIRHNGKVRSIPGYSAAYDRNAIASLPLCHSNALNEDALTTYVANLTGSLILSTSKTLLARRESQSSITPGHKLMTIADISRNERNISLFASSSIAFIEYFSTLSAILDGHDYNLVYARLLSELSYHKLTAIFWSYSYVSRIRLFASCRTPSEFYFVLPRLLGLPCFLYSKYLICFLSLFFRTRLTRLRRLFSAIQLISIS